MDVSTQDAVIELRQDETMAAIIRSITESVGEALDQRVDSTREQKRAKGVALLDASDRIEEAALKNQVRVLTIQPLGPT